MAESPFKITRSDDGLSVRCEFDAHYISDEDAQRIRGYIDQLQAENAKLRDEFRKMDEWHSKELIATMDENAKLRELVKYAYECAIHSDHATCDDCERMNGCCILVDRMRELGIEVMG